MDSAPTNFSWGRGRPRGRPSLPAPSTQQVRLTLINQSNLKESSTPGATLHIHQVTYVASYNLIDDEASTVVVPGKPPKWGPPTEVQRLNQDRGCYLRDPNSAQFPRHPLEPAVRAIYELNPNFATSAIDIFGCGSTIGSLLSFVRGEERTFRFGVERVGNTVFLIRRTNTPGEIIDDIQGFGHSFLETYTNWEREVLKSFTHQRIINYHFGGFNCLIRTEIDGYFPHKLSADDSLLHQSRPHKESVLSGNTSTHQELNLDGALSLYGGLWPKSRQSDKVVIQQGGNPIDQIAIFDLKTRSAKRKDEIDISEFIPRLWVGQIPNFVLAWHKSGLFDDIEIKDMSRDVAEWEQKNASALGLLQDLLKQIIEHSYVDNRSRFEVRRLGFEDLQFWSEVPGTTVLPSELRAQWIGAEILGVDKHTDTTVKAKESDEEDHLKF